MKYCNLCTDGGNRDKVLLIRLLIRRFIMSEIFPSMTYNNRQESKIKIYWLWEGWSNGNADKMLLLSTYFIIRHHDVNCSHNCTIGKAFAWVPCSNPGRYNLKLLTVLLSNAQKRLRMLRVLKKHMIPVTVGVAR